MMHPEAVEELRVRFKQTVLEIAKVSSNAEACREFNVPRSSFYSWKTKDDKHDRIGL
jgi:hypothetical protein